MQLSPSATAQEAHRASISNMEFVRLDQRPTSTLEGPQAASFKDWYLECRAGIEQSPGCKPLATGRRLRSPVGSQKGAPCYLWDPLGYGTYSPSHSISLQLGRAVAGLESASAALGLGAGRARQGLESRAPDKTSKCFTDKFSPFLKSCSII